MLVKTKGVRWLTLAALVVGLGVAAVGCGGDDEEAAPPVGGLGSQFDVASAGDVTLELWWLGDLEAPGIEAWMDETVSLFEAQYPNVNVETTLYETGKWIQTQQTACQSQSGPDLWYNWSGTWSLEPAWKGCTAPNEDVLSAEDIAANPHAQETLWQGKTWDFPLYQFVYPIVYNKSLFEQAGLDPESPPTTWEDFLAAMEALRAAGITPFALGLKDGFGAEILAAGQLEKQHASGPDDYKQRVIDGDFTAEDWALWLEKAVEMKPYFNEDANSLGFAEGLALFQNEQAAMVAGAPGVQAVIKAMTDEGKQVGIMKAPVFDDGAWADSLVHTGNGFQVTSWSQDKEVAGAFMAFMQTPERLEALYAATGNFPTSTNWDSSQVTSPTDLQMLGWLGEKGDVFWAANYTPVDLDVNATFVVFQKLLAGELSTAEEMAQLYQDVIEKWREANPPVVENFRSWLG
jgi:multiple sugar transport system substrate-binding protein